ncbi:MAG: hypothetical protein E6J05_06820 [Chloroflexi bacterium]|nr:MAG: hypothetical protein E6J05_06820 [Chloroflexota bacterium]
MNREWREQVEGIRQRGPIERTLLDEYFDIRYDRREFIRRATVFGLSLSTIAMVLESCGTTNPTPKVGGRLKVGIIPPPAHTIEPHTFADQGALETGSIAGEHLIRTAAGLQLVPELATSWTPNSDASSWTVKLRSQVKFQTGQAMTADDVVATYNRLVDPNSGSQAISAFKGSLSPGGITKVDDLTVKFQLDAPTASFPYLLSSTTYQGIILPANYKLGSFTSTPQTTGAFKITSYTPGVGAKYDRYNDWWGGHAALDGVDVTYYSDAAAADSALIAGTIDLIGQIQLATDRSLFNNPKVQIFSAHGATHRQVPMRVDLNNPLKDSKVRQAIALTLDRPSIVKTLFTSYADIGNDTPWAPVYPSSVGAPWGHVAVPNVFLTAALETGGVWNDAHYSSPEFDAAAKGFIGAISLSDQKKFSKQAETILLADTPVIFPYFYYYLAAGSKSVKGYYGDPQGNVFLSHTSLG